GRYTASITPGRKEDNKKAIIYLDDIRVIPIVFLPGIMGSNLQTIPKNKNLQGDAIWRLDGKTSLLGWSLPFAGSATKRKEQLDPNKVQVDDRGKIIDPLQYEMAVLEGQYPPGSRTTREEIDAYNKAKEAVLARDTESKLFGSRRDRGWGQVAKMSYGTFLDWLQHTLHRDKKGKACQELLNKLLGVEYSREAEALTEGDLKVLDNYRFPVHAMGYNWLGSNIESAERLKNYIDALLKKYREAPMKYKCNKVILVTHSMGGLVARYYSEVLGGKANIYGIVHGVMPSTGAPAAYTRMKRGTENPQSTPQGYIISHVLGRNAAEMTAICSQSPGPLELLPSPLYGKNWLNIVDRHGNKKSYPDQDPYTDIYLNQTDWWRLNDLNLLNPQNSSGNPAQLAEDWIIFKKIMIESVEVFHTRLADKYHSNTHAFYGLDTATPDRVSAAYATHQVVTWKGELAKGLSPMPWRPTAVRQEGDLLDPKELMGYRTTYT
ncbi:triacylglycerol lipase, partial [Serratia sp. Ag1]|uniref:esterase/lipase family protein n=1 Tax=Serratia sp. Ag1 TaxID=1524467 RepID=UPI000907A5B9